MFSKKLLLQGVLISLLIGGCVIKDIPKKSSSDKPVVLFILDTSESMLNLENGKPKIDNAKASILKTIKKMDNDKFNTALITFDKVRKCKAKREVDFSKPTDISTKIINNIKAWGVSPLADAIALSNTILSDTEKKMVILLSDGKDNCGGNPIEEAKKLYKKYGVKVNLQVIGYAVEKKNQEELKKIALISRDWMYHDAKNGTAVQKIIDKIMPPKAKKKIISPTPTLKPTPTIVNIQRERPIAIETNRDVKMEIESFIFNFDTGSDSIKGNFILKVEELNNYLTDNNKSVLIIGHADARGTEKFNKHLSLKRAKSLKDKLVELGVNNNQIEITGKGELEPIAPNNTVEGQRENRRVEIKVLD